MVILLLVLGIFFRFFNLERKVYWLDETYTSLRLSGYTSTEFVQQVVTGEILSVAALRPYQQINPERGLQDTFKGLAIEEPQLTPLYFMLTRFWVQGLGDSVGVIRSLSAVVSLLAFPCLWWLCRELFLSAWVGWVAMALFAVSPLQVLYAQEARPYSLWTVMILLSSAALLWAMRCKKRLGWSLYAVTVALGLYTHLLFGSVAVAHAVYVVATEQQGRKRWWHLSPTLRSYGVATSAGSSALFPWLVVLSHNFAQAEAMTSTLREPTSISFLLNQWLVNSSRVFVGWDLGFANLIPLIGILYALYFLCSATPKRTWLLLIALIAVPFLMLALPDLLLEGERSTRIRYLIPCYVGMQIALAYLLTHPACWLSDQKQRWCRAALVGLVGINIAACCISSQSTVWWSKSVPRSSYYLPVAALINQVDAPLVISDSAPMEVLAFSRRLDPDVKLKLITRPKAVKVPTSFDAVFLLNPSNALQTVLRRRNYRLTLVYVDRNAPKASKARLWQVERP